VRSSEGPGRQSAELESKAEIDGNRHDLAPQNPECRLPFFFRATRRRRQEPWQGRPKNPTKTVSLDAKSATPSLQGGAAGVYRCDGTVDLDPKPRARAPSSWETRIRAKVPLMQRIV
jgi:hypothetical protein